MRQHELVELLDQAFPNSDELTRFAAARLGPAGAALFAQAERSGAVPLLATWIFRQIRYEPCGRAALFDALRERAPALRDRVTALEGAAPPAAALRPAELRLLRTLAGPEDPATFARLEAEPPWMLDGEEALLRYGPDEPRLPGEAPERAPMERVACAGRRLLVFGDPGGGKTALVRRIARVLSREHLGLAESGAHALRLQALGGAALPIPVPCATGQLASRLQAADATAALLRLLREEIFPDADPGLLEEDLAADRYWFLIDGTELPDALARALDAAPALRVLLTARPSGEAPDTFAQARIAPLSEAAQREIIGPRAAPALVARWRAAPLPDNPRDLHTLLREDLGWLLEDRERAAATLLAAACPPEIEQRYRAELQALAARCVPRGFITEDEAITALAGHESPTDLLRKIGLFRVGDLADGRRLRPLSPGVMELLAGRKLAAERADPIAVARELLSWPRPRHGERPDPVQILRFMAAASDNPTTTLWSWLRESGAGGELGPHWLALALTGTVACGAGAPGLIQALRQQTREMLGDFDCNWPMREQQEALEAVGVLGDWRLPDPCQPAVPGAPPGWAEVPAGRYLVGPRRGKLRTVRGFFVRIWPVTVAEFAAFARENEARSVPLPEDWATQRRRPNRPVTGVDWRLARAFCRWATRRWALPADGVVDLPTAVEWDVAVRRGTLRPFPWPQNRHATLREAAFDPGEHPLAPFGATPVGAFIDGYTSEDEEGLWDAAGNVWEWCVDAVAPSVPNVEHARVKRGGSWRSPGKSLECSALVRAAPGSRDDSTGFRVVLRAARARPRSPRRAGPAPFHPEEKRLLEAMAPIWRDGLLQNVDRSRWRIQLRTLSARRRPGGGVVWTSPPYEANFHDAECYDLLSLDRALSRCPRAVLAGRAGAGKSEQLQHLAWILSHGLPEPLPGEVNEDPGLEHELDPAVLAARFVPILCRAEALAARLGPAGGSIRGALELLLHGVYFPAIPRESIAAALRNNRFWMLLDDADALDEAARGALFEALGRAPELRVTLAVRARLEVEIPIPAGFQRVDIAPIDWESCGRLTERLLGAPGPQAADACAVIAPLSALDREFPPNPAGDSPRQSPRLLAALTRLCMVCGGPPEDRELLWAMLRAAAPADLNWQACVGVGDAATRLAARLTAPGAAGDPNRWAALLHPGQDPRVLRALTGALAWISPGHAADWIECLLDAAADEPDREAHLLSLAGTFFADCEATRLAGHGALKERIRARVRDGFSARGADWPLAARLDALEALGRLGDPRLDDPIRAADFGGAWVLIPGGEYPVGDSTPGGDRLPEEPVLVAPFFMRVWPVTVAEFSAFVQSGAIDEPNFWQSGRYRGQGAPDDWLAQLRLPNRPVVRVDWFTARAFCVWASQTWRLPGPGTIDLPTTFEWEAAARGGTRRRFVWDADPDHPAAPGAGDQARAWYGWTDFALQEERGPAPVGAFPRGHTPGAALWDMTGNVCTWCATGGYHGERADRAWSALAPRAPRPRMPEAPDFHGQQLVRGASFFDLDFQLDATRVETQDPAYMSPRIGFRVVFRPGR